MNPMERALELARQASSAGEVPVGAVIVDSDGAVLAAERNRVEELGDATAHAELLAIRSASVAAGSKWLAGCHLYVTLEPCAMCAMAAVWSRLERIVYAAPDPKAGASWSLYNIPQDKRLNHYVELEDGVMEVEAAKLLREFFRERRV